MHRIFSLIFLSSLFNIVVSAQGLSIQENELGFCSIDGIIDTDVAGYTGEGFANAHIAEGTSALWNIMVPTEGTYHIYWQYANGGGAGDLAASLWVNETAVIDNFLFEHTDKWTNWRASDTIAVDLKAGENRIRLISISPSGLANIDFFHIIEEGVEAAFCLPSYSLNVSKNFAEGGTISYEPVQAFYDAGTEITLKANAETAYFFQSWSGGETSTESTHTFQINQNANIEALFYPDGTEAEAGVIGYASVQDDEGTPYLMTGGLFGDTVLATNYGTLKKYLESDQPYVVTVANYIYSTGTINITSDKTLLGITDSAHLEGIRIKINRANNVILRNMTFSKVVRFDAIEINNANHIWIDNCDLFSDLQQDKDYYDGLLDIKNSATFITVSNTKFHDHHKAILISSGDDSFQDTTIRITFHHNYFHNLESRTPLLRFGKAHIFNNYFRNCSSGINSRMGACIRVEENYFERVSNATRTDMSAVRGSFQILDNVFERSNYVSEPECELDVPYEYLSVLDDAEMIAELLGENSLGSTSEYLLNLEMSVYPNPAENQAAVKFNLPTRLKSEIVLYDLLGKKVKVIANKLFQAGENHVLFTIEDISVGLYVLSIHTEEGTANQAIIIE